MPAAATRSLADDHPAAPLRGGEILPDPDFSLLRASDAYLVGVRPHREGGVCLKLDDELIPSQHGSKFLIHNYGHGGAGITLSFGCASVVADLTPNLENYAIATFTHSRSNGPPLITSMASLFRSYS